MRPTATAADTSPAGHPRPRGMAPLAAGGKVLGYLADNRDSLWYGQRLKRGQPIDTGLIWGGCKNIIAARPKLNSPRWRAGGSDGPSGRASPAASSTAARGTPTGTNSTTRRT